jgi:hypothetical protein
MQQQQRQQQQRVGDQAHIWSKKSAEACLDTLLSSECYILSSTDTLLAVYQTCMLVELQPLPVWRHWRQKLTTTLMICNQKACSDFPSHLSCLVSSLVTQLSGLLFSRVDSVSCRSTHLQHHKNTAAAAAAAAAALWRQHKESKAPSLANAARLHVQAAT